MKPDGNRVVNHTIEQAGSVVDGLAGAAAGSEVGRVVGWGAGKAAMQVAEKGIDLGKKAWHGVSKFFAW
jgi:hypothetical protein